MTLSEKLLQMKKQKTPDIYRAWSSDWTKSITFYGTIINSKYWDKFKTKLTSILGEGWGWELAINSDKISSDLNDKDYSNS